MGKDEGRVPESLARVVRDETLGGMVARQDAQDQHSEKVSALLGSLQKFALGGNAGGAIATMSLIGTALAKTQPPASPSYPWEYFATLLLFIAGLIASWWTTAAKLRRASAEKSFWETAVDVAAREDKPLPRWSRPLLRSWLWMASERGGVTCATVLLVAGMLLGLYSLAALARW